MRLQGRPFLIYNDAQSVPIVVQRSGTIVTDSFRDHFVTERDRCVIILVERYVTMIIFQYGPNRDLTQEKQATCDQSGCQVANDLE